MIKIKGPENLVVDASKIAEILSVLENDGNFMIVDNFIEYLQSENYIEIIRD